MTATSTNGRATPTERRVLHPPLAEVAFGGVVIATICDVISAADAGSHTWSHDLYRSATFTLMVATTAMLFAIVTGLIDRGRGTPKASRPRAQVNKHAIIMTTLTVVSVIELGLRRQKYAGAAYTPGFVLFLTLVLVALTLVGGELGGRLVYRGGINVSRAKGSPVTAARTTAATARATPEGVSATSQ